jgi:hypothetical protein
MKKLLFILETTTISDPQYRFTFDQLIQIFNEHIQRFFSLFIFSIIYLIDFSEENSDLPKLENAITQNLNHSLAQSFQQTINSNYLK